MNQEQKKSAAIVGALIDLEDIFAPGWARQSADEAPHHVVRYAPDSSRDGRRPPRDRDRGGYRDRDTDRPRRDRHGGRSEPDERGRPRQRRLPRRESADSSPFKESVRKPREEPLDINVRFQPEQKALNAIIKRIQTTHKAYPFKDIVRLFINSDDSLVVRIEKKRDDKSEWLFHQCGKCGLPARTEEEILDHLLQVHIQDFFEVEEIETEPPNGNFPCVARCGLSGELLGPPNHHSFASKVAEMLRTRYPKMSEDEYRNRVEMVHDPEVVEEWRAGSRRKQIYLFKTEEEAGLATVEAQDQPAESQADTAATEAPEEKQKPSPMEKNEAENYLRREIAPANTRSGRHVTCQAAILKGLPDRHLAGYLLSALDFEVKRKGSLHYALHGAFQRRGLSFFRADTEKGPEFVMAAKPTPMTAHAVSRLREIVAFIGDNPSCTYQELSEGVLSEGDDVSKAELATQVEWLSERGHIIAYFNGTLSVAAEHPVYRSSQRRKKKIVKKEADPKIESGEVETGTAVNETADQGKGAADPESEAMVGDKGASDPEGEVDKGTADSESEAMVEDRGVTEAEVEVEADKDAADSKAEESAENKVEPGAEATENEVLFENSESEEDDW